MSQFLLEIDLPCNKHETFYLTPMVLDLIFNMVTVFVHAFLYYMLLLF
jgi:hypothetical protein